ncbi:hypothetical protein T4E_8532 [Trichinella pseudospiralis]|uniref:Uncharacterized protein n=1 Tax=Trichinella pseudospiralis TaxID=6337 RepID=A0A0V0XJ02_TRIPS|nr:hypothetical protein T4E_8532 [Trichinella pseudospiralis]
MTSFYRANDFHTFCTTVDDPDDVVNKRSAKSLSEEKKTTFPTFNPPPNSTNHVGKSILPNVVVKLEV